MYIARFTGDRVQSVREHINNVAEYCSIWAKPSGLENTAKLCGYLHDIGKYSNGFQRYISSEKEGHQEINEKVDHGVYGAKFIYEMHNKKKTVRDIIAEVVCYHHGGLPDNVDENGRIPLITRMNKINIKEIEDIEKNFYKENPNVNIDKLLDEATIEIDNVSKKMKQRRVDYGYLIKLLYSYLVDADRWDSYLFQSEEKYKEKTIEV